MKQWITAAALTSMALTASPVVGADEDTQLFKEWHYGQHIDEFPRSLGYYDCTADLGVLALCNDNVTFLQHSFQGQLSFADDNTLVSTSIVTDYSNDLYATLIGALIRDFGLIFAEGPDDSLDLVYEIHQGSFTDEASLKRALNSFEGEQLRAGYLVMTLVEQSALDQLFADSRSADDILLKLQPGTRAIDVFAYEDDYWGPTLEASFHLPGRQLRRMEDKVRQAPVEDF
ncbi:hypothetical protein [Vreelandella arcis]|uniref:Uncharacterized protein n=1 Tax=Vreelandella arcis TaxID=416873 RepID=A0A1H0CRY2_9GAMM|nr:hypothetical protein [Halomonas arcis]SDN60555.1 hypothetical protein SAMN04487951_106171 [Halomonas arcis]